MDEDYPIIDPYESVEVKARRIGNRILTGNPIKYRANYHIPLLISLFIEGNDIAAFCAGAEICRKTFVNWVNNYPAFSEAYDTAKDLARIYWEKVAEVHMENPNFNTKLWSMKMRNRFDYTDHRKLSIPALRSAKNTKEQITCVIEELATGNLTGSEANQLGTLIKTAIEVDVHDEVKKDIKGIQDRLGIES